MQGVSADDGVREVLVPDELLALWQLAFPDRALLCAIVSRSPNRQMALTEFAPPIMAMTTIDSMAAAGMDLLSSRQSLTLRMAS